MRIEILSKEEGNTVSQRAIIHLEGELWREVVRAIGLASYRIRYGENGPLDRFLPETLIRAFDKGFYSDEHVCAQRVPWGDEWISVAGFNDGLTNGLETFVKLHKKGDRILFYRGETYWDSPVGAKEIAERALLIYNM